MRRSKLTRILTLVGLVVAGAVAMGGPVPTQADASAKTLGMFTGYNNGAKFFEYERSLNVQFRWAMAIGDHSSPTALGSSAWGQLASPEAYLPGISQRTDLVFTVPLAFGSANARTDAGRRQIADNLRRTAAGEYDVMYRKVARRLIDAGYSDAVIRLGHEHDHQGYPWSSRGNEAGYIAAYRHVHGVMSSESRGFRFDWNSTRAPFIQHARKAYPGDAFVDIIGLDWYYRHTEPVSDRVWNNQYLPTLREHLNFAQSRGKTIGYAEWGSATVDDPAVIDRAVAWMAQLPSSGPGSLEYQIYFNQFSSRSTVGLEQLPRTKARYLAAFKNGGSSGSPQPPVTNPPVTTPPATNPPATNPPATNPPATSPPATAPPATTPPATTLPAGDGVVASSGGARQPSIEAQPFGPGAVLAEWDHPDAKLYQLRYRIDGQGQWTWDPPSSIEARFISDVHTADAVDLEVRAYLDRNWQSWNRLTVPMTAAASPPPPSPPADGPPATLPTLPPVTNPLPSNDLSPAERFDAYLDALNRTSTANSVEVSITSGRAKAEGQSIPFKLELNQASSNDVLVRVATADGTAKAGSDYRPRDVSLVIPAGDKTAWVGVPSLTDRKAEGRENVRMRVVDVAGATVSRGEASNTILG